MNAEKQLKLRMLAFAQILATNLNSIFLNQQFPLPMSAKIILDNITTSSSPSLFTDQISFQVTFTAIQPTLYPLSWRITYVGSAYSEDFDQTLEQFQIDPVEEAGTMKFDIICSAPNPCKIPRKQLICVTALLITASYNQQQFIRVGYYVHNQLVVNEGEEVAIDDLPLEQLIKKIKRTIISDKPRVTKFNIDWQKDKSNKTRKINQDSQSKLEDYFSVSIKGQSQQDSTSQKLALKANQTNENCPINSDMKQNLPKGIRRGSLQQSSLMLAE